MGVLIVDDSSAFRHAARSLLERRGYDILGEASGVTDALARAAELRPAAALIDARLPDGSGFDLAAELRRQLPRLAVLITSSDDEVVAHALAAACGARGFVPKSQLAGCELERYWRCA